MRQPPTAICRHVRTDRVVPCGLARPYWQGREIWTVVRGAVWSRTHVETRPQDLDCACRHTYKGSQLHCYTCSGRSVLSVEISQIKINIHCRAHSVVRAEPLNKNECTPGRQVYLAHDKSSQFLCTLPESTGVLLSCAPISYGRYVYAFLCSVSVLIRKYSSFRPGLFRLRFGGHCLWPP